MELSFKVNTLSGTQIVAENVAYNEEVVQQYINNQSGPLSTIGGGEATGTFLHCLPHCPTDEALPQPSKNFLPNLGKISATLHRPSSTLFLLTGPMQSTCPSFTPTSPETSLRRTTTYSSVLLSCPLLQEAT